MLVDVAVGSPHPHKKERYGFCHHTAFTCESQIATMVYFIPSAHANFRSCRVFVGGGEVGGLSVVGALSLFEVFVNEYEYILVQGEGTGGLYVLGRKYIPMDVGSH